VLSAAVITTTALAAQALIMCRSSLVCMISIFRGLAFSATGIRRVRTPDV
jgi:hypothetical protein